LDHRSATKLKPAILGKKREIRKGRADLSTVDRKKKLHVRTRKELLPTNQKKHVKAKKRASLETKVRQKFGGQLSVGTSLNKIRGGDRQLLRL